MNRGKKSLLNAITAIAYSGINGLMGLIVTRLVLKTYGSDFNGLNSTASQLVSMLLILEGGFSIATNVALFTPYLKKEYNEVNAILAATKYRFQKVGLLFGGCGIVISIAYTLLVKSNLNKEIIFTVLIMALAPSAFNLFYAMKYRVVLQAEQKEYIISFINIITISCGYITNIIFTQMRTPMWTIRFGTMLWAFINYIVLSECVKRTYHFIDFTVPPDFNKIAGTKDVFVQKITGVIYNTMPIVFLSISSFGGTVMASVYAVYNNIFVLLKSIMHAVTDAPRLSLGQMMAEKEKDEVWKVFAQYQLIVVLMLFCCLTTTAVLILPFVNLYAGDIKDVNYYNPYISLLLTCITMFELIHIPSGHLINMSGNFKVSKNFQVISCIVLVVSMIVGGNLLGIYGMLLAVLLVAILLAILEVGYVHQVYFRGKLLSFLKIVLPFMIIGIILVIGENRLPIIFTSYFKFVVVGAIILLVNSILGVIVSFIFCRQYTSELLSRLIIILRKINRERNK